MSICIFSARDISNTTQPSFTKSPGRWWAVIKKLSFWFLNSFVREMFKTALSLRTQLHKTQRGGIYWKKKAVWCWPNSFSIKRRKQCKNLSRDGRDHWVHLERNGEWSMHSKRAWITRRRSTHDTAIGRWSSNCFFLFLLLQTLNLVTSLCYTASLFHGYNIRCRRGCRKHVYLVLLFSNHEKR